MKGESLDIIYGLNVLSAIDAWSLIFDHLTKRGVSENANAKLYDKKVILNNISKEVSKLKRNNFLVKIEGMSFNYGAVASWEHTVIVIEDKFEPVRLNWQELVNDFFNKSPFVQAWVSSIEYDHWQNAKDPLQYDAVGKSYEGLPMKSNGLPFPLEQMNIDISNNPCRRILCDGYVEAIGAQMWFGEKFEKIANVSLNSITVDGCQIEEQNGLYHIDCGVDVFKDESTAELQKQLRSALYSK